MKIFVSLLKLLLGLWTIMGAVYMMGHFGDLGSSWALGELPAVFWTGVGIVQIVLAIVLIVSVWPGCFRKFVSPAASVLAVIALAGSVLYSAYSGFPGILWALIPAALLAFIAYKN